MRLSGLAGGLVVACAIVAACSDDPGPTPTPTSRREAPTPRFASGPACETAGVGRACTGPELCEIGDADDLSCNRHLRCNGFAWELADSARTGNGARACTVCAGIEAGTCGALCGSEDEGVICGCTTAADAGREVARDGGADADSGDAETDASIDAEADAGDADAAHDAETDTAPDAEVAAAPIDPWRCVGIRRGCPRRRPRVGEPCVKPMSCDYGACVLDRGVSMACSGGFWTEEMIACPR